MKVLLGMSGGIDSSVAALLLKQQGFEVIGVTLRLWSQNDSSDTILIPTYIEEAKKMAELLHIEHFVIDARTEFYNLVVTYFVDEYLQGRTPNPCAKCNVVLKWRLLDEYARKLKCDFIAMGHYVNKIQINGRYYITQGIDPDKDQSFFLWGLNQNLLEKALFPLGELTKMEVRKIAYDNGFITLTEKKESTGACFLNNQNYAQLLQNTTLFTNSGIVRGNFVDKTGTIIGQHNGFPFYTVGQRRGLGLAPNEPYYVTKINPNNNEIELGHRNDLYTNEMWITDFNVINQNDFSQPVITRIRYRKQSALSRVNFIDEKTLMVSFIEPEWSIAPGQTAAFYQNNVLLGGGFILK